MEHLLTNSTNSIPITGKVVSKNKDKNFVLKTDVHTIHPSLSFISIYYF